MIEEIVEREFSLNVPTKYTFDSSDCIDLLIKDSVVNKNHGDVHVLEVLDVLNRDTAIILMNRGIDGSGTISLKLRCRVLRVIKGSRTVFKRVMEEEKVYYRAVGYRNVKLMRNSNAEYIIGRISNVTYFPMKGTIAVTVHTNKYKKSMWNMAYQPTSSYTLNKSQQEQINAMIEKIKHLESTLSGKKYEKIKFQLDIAQNKKLSDGQVVPVENLQKKVAEKKHYFYYASGKIYSTETEPVSYVEAIDANVVSIMLSQVITELQFYGELSKLSNADLTAAIVEYSSK